MGEVRIKPLEWRRGYCDDHVTIEQASHNDLYQVRQFDGKVWLDHRQYATEYPDVEAAKAAAQADYEARIRSALVPDAAPEEGAPS